jgi:hypothetical protein
MDLCLNHQVDCTLIGESLGDARGILAVLRHLTLLHAYLGAKGASSSVAILLQLCWCWYCCSGQYPQIKVVVLVVVLVLALAVFRISGKAYLVLGHEFLRLILMQVQVTHGLQEAAAHALGSAHARSPADSFEHGRLRTRDN